MNSLSPWWKLAGWMPSCGLTVKKTWLMGPRISSTLPIADLFSRKMGALKYGIFAFVDVQTSSPSDACRKVPSSRRGARQRVVVVGGRVGGHTHLARPLGARRIESRRGRRVRLRHGRLVRRGNCLDLRDLRRDLHRGMTW